MKLTTKQVEAFNLFEYFSCFKEIYIYFIGKLCNIVVKYL